MARKLCEGVPPSVLSFADRLSPRAREAIARWQWSLDESRRFSRDELRQRLADKGFAEWSFLWPLEEAFAGTLARISGFDLDFGMASNLPYYERDELIDDQTGAEYVPIGDWGSFSIMLSEDGGMFHVAAPDRIERMDSSFAAFLEDRAMSTSLTSSSEPLFSAFLSPKEITLGLAETRGISTVVEASNEFHRWWQDDSCTLHQAGNDGPATIWAKRLQDLVAVLDAAVGLTTHLEVRPERIQGEENVEVLPREDVVARAPTPESLRDRPCSRRFTLRGEPSIHAGRPASTGDVWISGTGETLQIDVLESREGLLVNYWRLARDGGHALLSSRYGRG